MLILFLTVFSVGLALMQVLSSTSLWIGLSPGLIGALLILMFFLIVVAACRKVRRQKASEDPSPPPKRGPVSERNAVEMAVTNRERIGKAPDPGLLHYVGTDCLTHVIHASVSCGYGVITSFPLVSRPANARCASAAFASG